jgi:hypothetical protein
MLYKSAKAVLRSILMKVLKNISIAVGSLLVLFIVVGMLLPSKWEVSRSINIAANKETIYSAVANLHRFIEWSPWTGEEDPSLVYTYEGPEEGVGAKQNWTSEKMGKGWLEISEADPEKGIIYKLFIDMGRWQNNLEGQMAFEALDNETKVTWTDRGENGANIVKKWMALFMNSMLGKDLEKGLTKLKSLTEKEAQEGHKEEVKEEVAQAE